MRGATMKISATGRALVIKKSDRQVNEDSAITIRYVVTIQGKERPRGDNRSVIFYSRKFPSLTF